MVSIDGLVAQSRMMALRRMSWGRLIAGGLVGIAMVHASPAAARAQSRHSGDWPSLTLDYSNSRWQGRSTIRATNIAHIQQRWMISAPAGVTGTPVVLSGGVYFADLAGKVYAASVATGAIAWEVNLGAPISSTLALANGMVYVALGPAGPTRVVALSQADGHSIWSTTLSSTMGAIWASPIVYNNLVYVGLATGWQQEEDDPSLIGEIDALDGITGAPVWKFTTMTGTAGGAGVWGSVAVDPVLNAIYFGTGNSFSSGTDNYAYSIISLNATDGSMNWYNQLYDSSPSGRNNGNNDFGSTPNLFAVVIGGTQYNAVGLGSKNGDYYVVDRNTGSLLEVLPFRFDGGGDVGLAAYHAAAPLHAQLFVPSAGLDPNPLACCGSVDAVTPSTGHLDWNFTANSYVFGSVTGVPGAVLFGDAGGDLYALSTRAGRPLLHLVLGGSIDGGVTVAEGFVLVPVWSGNAQTSGVYGFSD